MTPNEFRERLARLGYSQSGFGRYLATASGAPPATTLRLVQRMAAGDSRVSHEMQALLNALDRLSENGLLNGREQA